MPAAGAPITRGEAAAVVGLGIGGGAIADGLLIAEFGTSDLAPTLPAGGLAAALVAIGALATLGSVAVLRGRVRTVLTSVAPRLYPYASPSANTAVYLVILLSAVAVYAGFFEMFVGAHDNGDFASVGDQTALSILVDTATVLLWIVTGYAVLLIHRMVSIGRFLDAPRTPTDAYGAPVDPPDPPSPPRPGWSAPPAPDGRSRATLLALSVGLAFAIAAGIQVAEVGLAPASAVDWWAGQVLLPAMPIAVVFGTGAIGRGVGEMERRFVARWPVMPDGARVTAPAV